jgi:hypothetical protein
MYSAKDWNRHAGAQRVEVHALVDCQIAHDQIAQMRRRRHDPETAIADDRADFAPPHHKTRRVDVDISGPRCRSAKRPAHLIDTADAVR